MDSGWQVLLGYVKGALSFMLIIVVLVGVHELGHFWFARMFGMRVNAFAIMMGGIRKTDLSSRLKKPLVSGWILAIVGSIAAAATIAGGIGNIPWLFQTGLIGIAIVMPVWVTSRLQALYQLPKNGAYRTLLTAWAVGLGFLLFATRLQGVTVSTVLSILFFASSLGVLLVYYNPVLAKEESSEQGFGELNLDGEKVPVRFRPLWFRKDRHGTEYSILALPLGGFVSIHGIEAKDDGSEINEPGGFYSKSATARFLTLFAGPLFSVLLGIVILTGVLMTAGKAVEKAQFGEIVPGKPAARAGLQKGDIVTSIDGKPVTGWYDMISSVRDSAGKTLTFVVQRKDQQLTIPVTPVLSDTEVPVLDKDLMDTGKKRRQGQIGTTRGTQPMPIGEAFTRACATPIIMVKGLASVILKPSTAKDNLGGPASIAQATHEAANEGILSLLRMAGLLSVSLGVMNLLPISPLDGGQMVVAFAEMLRGGKRLNIQVQRLVQSVGVIMILGLMALVIFFDISRNVTGK